MTKKRELAGYKSELSKHANIIKQELNSIKSKKITELQSEIEKLSSFYNELFEIENNTEQQIQNLLNNSNDSYLKIKGYYEELLVGNEGESHSIQEKIAVSFNQIQKYYEELVEGTNENKSTKEKIQGVFQQIQQYHKNIFGTKEIKDEEGNIIEESTLGYKKELERLYEDNKDKYNTLTTKVESLLPGATSAGLSTAYRDMKKSFTIPNIIWNIIFIISLLTLSVFSFYNMRNVSFSNTMDIFSFYVPRLPYIIPLVWLAYFASKQHSQNKRLQQEYSYKESLAKSFEGYKKQIDSLGEDEKSLEIKQLLMENIVKMTGENPSETLDRNHGTNPPFWEHIFNLKNKK